MMTRDRWTLAVSCAAAAALALCMAACDSGAGGEFVVDDTLCLNGGACGGPMTSYPGGPYGTTEGSRLANLEFLDTVGATTSMHALRADGNAKLMLISTTAGWCAACIEEQPKLEALYREFACDGLDVMVAIFEDLNYSAATEVDAADWKTRFALSYTVVADPDFHWGAYYDPAATPMTMLVDLCTMEIIMVNTGFDETLVRSLIEARL